MKKFIKVFALVVTLLTTAVFSVCGGGAPSASKTGKPAWILNPNMNGKTGAVGVAGRTYDQKISSQRKLAIARALDELSLQNGVKVNLSMHKEEHLRNNSASKSIDVKSDYTTTNQDAITAHIEDIYQDNLSGELYIWLVLDK